MHVQLTVMCKNQIFQKGSAVWSENVTTSGFLGCVLVAGQQLFGGVPAATVF